MPIKMIDPNTLKSWLAKDEALVIDVREPHEFKLARIPGTVLIPLASLSTEKLPEHTGKKLVMHCHYGKRGTTACERLLLSNPSMDIYNLEGGLAAWVNAGYKVIQG